MLQLSVGSAVSSSQISKNCALHSYWDIFRDFLVTGEVPIKESYIIRQTPNSAGKFLSLVKEAGGKIGVKNAAKILETSESVVFNTSRELRLMGVLFSDKSGTIGISPEVLNAEDFNDAVHERISNIRGQTYFIILKRKL